MTERKKQKLKRKACDTIGGILITKKGCWVATSSGGPWDKQVGRIGSASIKGAGFDCKFD